jgi:hypothetical protein
MEIFSVLANLKIFVTDYNEKVAQSPTAQPPAFATSFLTHI